MTDADLARLEALLAVRDWAADLEVCEAATPGPWLSGQLWECHGLCRLATLRRGWRMTEPLVLYAAPTYHIDTPPSCAAFLGLAEEVWRGRALAAEEEVARLRAIIDGLAPCSQT